jgi:hypothetical protein
MRILWSNLSLSLSVPAGLDHSGDLPQGGVGLWRLDSTVARSGVIGDSLADNINGAMAQWADHTGLAMTETFVKQQKHSLTGHIEPVKIDDASAFLCRFENGSTALFEATRYARGHKALFTLEINGERTSASWDLHELHRLNYFDHRNEGRLRGWKSIHMTDGDHPYMKNSWVGSGTPDQVRAHLHTPRRRFHPRGARWRPCCSPHLPGWIGYRVCNACRLEIRKKRNSGKQYPSVDDQCGSP